MAAVSNNCLPQAQTLKWSTAAKDGTRNRIAITTGKLTQASKAIPAIDDDDDDEVPIPPPPPPPPPSPPPSASAAPLSNGIIANVHNNGTNVDENQLASSAPSGEPTIASSSTSYIPANIRLSSKLTWFRSLDDMLLLNHRQKFAGLVEFFNSSLDKYLKKKRLFEPSQSIGLELMMVGKAENTAAATILVICGSKIIKTVKRFFKEPHIKSQYQPDHPNLENPYFQIRFIARALTMPALETVPAYLPGSSVASSNDTSLCGLPVMFGMELGNARIATLGGVIMTVTGGKASTYAMTVGHLIYTPIAASLLSPMESKEGVDLLDDLHDDVYSSEDEDGQEDEDTYSSGDESYQEDEDDHEGADDIIDARIVMDDNAIYPKASLSTLLETERAIMANQPWLHIGSAFRSPLDLEGDPYNLDWGLITSLEDIKTFNRMNLYNGNHLWSRNEFSLSEDGLPPRKVIMLSGIDGPQEGYITFGTSFLALQPVNLFTRTHHIILNGQRGIKSGDCGAWVIDEATSEVYGHVVASNAFGGAYVIPLQDSFRQIKLALGVDSVKMISLDAGAHEYNPVERSVTSPLSAEGKLGGLEGLVSTQCYIPPGAPPPNERNRKDLEEAIRRGAQANNLSIHSNSKFDKSGILEDLEKVIRKAEQAVATTPENSPNLARYLNNLSISYNYRFSKLGILEDLEKAIQFAEKAVAATPKNKPDLVDYLNNLAIRYSSRFHKLGNQADFEKAAQAAEQAINTTPDKQRSRNRYLSLTFNNIASVYAKQGSYGKAIYWYQQALAGEEKCFGKIHSSTLSTMNNIAGVYNKQNKYDEAMQWYKRALAGFEEALGADHPSTLSTINNIAGVFASQGKYEVAMQWCERALASREETLGKNHLETLKTVNNMGTIFLRQGKYEEAMQWYARALAGKEKALGKDHPETLETVNNIGAVLDSQDHPETLNIINNIGLIFSKQGNYDKAMQWCKRAFIGWKQTFGDDHPSTLNTANDIGLIFSKKGEYTEAMNWHQRALIGQQEALGINHPSTLGTINNIGLVLNNQGKYEEAMQAFKGVLASQELILGKDHPSTLITVNNIGLVFNNQGKYKEAMEWYERALTSNEAILGKEHPETLNTVNNFALVFDNQGQYEEAMRWCERALAGYQKILGKDHPETLYTDNLLRTLRKKLSVSKNTTRMNSLSRNPQYLKELNTTVEGQTAKPIESIKIRNITTQ
ncbi:Nephrocystin-3 [Dactylellina cionopaga]|nr:Nephrocystin-3 [Dactylellina cionopaga]